MKNFLVSLVVVLFASFAFAADGDAGLNTQPEGTAKILKAPALITVPAHTVATAYVKAADYAPEGGYGEKDYDKAYENLMVNGFAKLVAWMETSKCHPIGPGFAVWFEDPAKVKPGELTAKAGFPVESSCDPTVSVIVESIAEYQAVSITYGGHYDQANNAWADITKWITDNGYEYDGNPIENFYKGPHESQNPEEWVTEIVWGVKKSEAVGEVKP